MSEKETRAAFARRMGVNKSTVTRWADAGRLVQEGGMVMVAQSVARVAETTAHRNDVAARHAEKRGAGISTAGRWAKNAPMADSSNPQSEEIEDGVLEGSGRNHYQVLAMQYENEAIKLGMAMRRGKRFMFDDVKREATDLGGMLRSSLEKLIDNCAPQLAAESGEAYRRAIIAKQLAAVRTAIKREFPRAMRRMRAEGAA